MKNNENGEMIDGKLVKERGPFRTESSMEGYFITHYNDQEIAEMDRWQWTDMILDIENEKESAKRSAERKQQEIEHLREELENINPRPKTPTGSLILFIIMALSLVIIAGIELVSLHQWLNGGV